MKREKLVVIVIAVLVIMNVALMMVLIFDRNVMKPPGGLFEKIVTETNMNRSQQQEFEVLRDEHRRNMDALNHKFQIAFAGYLNQITQSNSQNKDSIENLLVTIEKQKAAITLDHFSRVRALFTPGQKNKFDALLPELSKRMSGPRGAGIPPR